MFINKRTLQYITLVWLLAILPRVDLSTWHDTPRILGDLGSPRAPHLWLLSLQLSGLEGKHRWEAISLWIGSFPCYFQTTKFQKSVEKACDGSPPSFHSVSALPGGECWPSQAVFLQIRSGEKLRLASPLLPSSCCARKTITFWSACSSKGYRVSFWWLCQHICHQQSLWGFL